VTSTQAVCLKFTLNHLLTAPSPKSTLFEHSCLRGVISSSYCFGRGCGVPPSTLDTNVRYNLITDDVSILLSMWWPYASETSAGQVALRFV
jgi:hypothetical protein